MEKYVSFRYKNGYGLTWQQNTSLLGKVLAKPEFDPQFIEDILRKPIISDFIIKRLKAKFLPSSSVRVFCIHGRPFDTYVMFDPKNSVLIWCEIHVHDLPSPKVFVRKGAKNYIGSPANYYLIEPLPGLQLFAISPPQNRPFATNSNDYGIAIIATGFKTHHTSDHSHEPSERESGMLCSPLIAGKESGYLDDVDFHGEVMDLKELDFYGNPIWKIECKLDFGNKGEVTLPIFTSPKQQFGKEPLSKGEFILGVGSLQLFQLLTTESEKRSKDNVSANIVNKPEPAPCNRKPWWKFWKNEKKVHETSAELKVGGIYSVIQGNRKFKIAKLLVLEEGIVHLRLYKNKFNKRPDEINLNSLTLGTIHDPDGFGMGHIPIPEETFLSWQPRLLVQTDVNEEELEGYKIYKENGGMPFFF